MCVCVCVCVCVCGAHSLVVGEVQHHARDAVEGGRQVQGPARGGRIGRDIRVTRELDVSERSVGGSLCRRRAGRSEDGRSDEHCTRTEAIIGRPIKRSLAARRRRRRRAAAAGRAGGGGGGRGAGGGGGGGPEAGGAGGVFPGVVDDDGVEAARRLPQRRAAAAVRPRGPGLTTLRWPARLVEGSSKARRGVSERGASKRRTRYRARQGGTRQSVRWGCSSRLVHAHRLVGGVVVVQPHVDEAIFIAPKLVVFEKHGKVSNFARGAVQGVFGERLDVWIQDGYGFMVL